MADEPEWQTEEAWHWDYGRGVPPAYSVEGGSREQTITWAGGRGPMTDDVWRQMGYRRMRRQFKATEWEEVPADG